MRYSFVLLIFSTIACTQGDFPPLDSALHSSHPAMVRVMFQPKVYEVQILYTQIDRDENGQVSFTDHSFRLNENQYFYPASTVKLPVAVLALEYIDSIANLNARDKYVIARDSLSHSIEDDVRQIFAVSDNEAYNRLYELLGRDHINAKLRSKNLAPVRISHRLSTPNSDVNQRDTLFFSKGEQSIGLSGGYDNEIEIPSLQQQIKGKGFMRNDSLIDHAMDFSEKNYFPLKTQHELMKHLFFPELYKVKERFQLSEESLQLLKKHMRTVPRNNGYDSDEFYDSYGKFFIYGDQKEALPSQMKIYNKVGYAYGTITETAYITDEKENIEFFLSATILANKNGIFNDDTYEYDEIAIPFMAQLGREMYLYEYSRK